MIFLNSILLFGTAAAAVPIIIHLLNKRKVQHVTWAAMRFLREAIEQNQRRLRIEDLLLLLLRCLLLILLALTLARPAVRGAAASGRGATTAVVIVDSSYSMSASDGMRSAFDRAKDAAAGLIDGFPTGSKVAVWTSSNAVNPLIAEPTADLSLARSSIISATRTDRATDLLPPLRRAAELLKRLEGPREIDLITDGQASGFKAMSDIVQTLSSASDVSTHVILIHTPAFENLCVSELRPLGEMMLVNHSIRFAATVTNNGITEAHDVRVSLRIDGGEPADETIISSIPAGATGSAFLFARLTTEGYHTISASIPPDRLPADDTRTIAVHALAGIRVLLVDGEPTHDRDGATFYLQRLFAVSDAASATGTPPVTATVVDSSGLQQQPLDNYSAVVLADVPSLNAKDTKALADYVQRGGGLLVFAGDQLQRSFYNDQLLTNLKLLPAAYGDARGEIDASKKLLTFESSNHYDHPIAEVWNGWNDGNVGLPGLVNIFRLMPLTPDARETTDVAGPPRTILRFSDHSPAVMERTFGLGRVIQFAIPAGVHWDDLPLHVGTFVPLVFRSLAAIVSRQDDGLNVGAGSPFTFHPNAQYLNQDATIIRPGDSSDANAPHDVRPVQLIGSEPTVTDEQTDTAGGYGMTFGDGTSLRFAVQSDPNESKLDPLTPDQQRELASVARITDSAGGIDTADTTQAQSAHSSLGEWWPKFAIATIVLAVIEMTCAWWFSRAK